MTRDVQILAARFGVLAADEVGVPDGRPPLVFLHGLGFDRLHWTPILDNLAAIDRGRHAVSFDLPGHGGSPARLSYGAADLAVVVHDAVRDAGLDAPIVVGHSFSGVLATTYAAMYPTRGVVNVDQPLLAGGFAERLRMSEPVLRGPEYAQVWTALLAGMHVEELPADAQAMIVAAPLPPRELLLGYWYDLLVMSAGELSERTVQALAALRSAGVPYRYVTGAEPSQAYADWLRSMLPDVSISVFPGTGHFPHLARPAEFAKLLCS